MTVQEIIECINSGKTYKIYKTKEWLRLKREVLEEFHFECASCKAKGIITMAQTVHHVKHVKEFPHLAYSKYYIDIYGRKKRNLIPLCNSCHNEEHDRFKKKRKKAEKPLTEERW